MTLAVTVIVSLTVEPELGDVIETTRLPSWADTVGAINPARPIIASSGVIARADRTILICGAECECSGASKLPR